MRLTPSGYLGEFVLRMLIRLHRPTNVNMYTNKFEMLMCMGWGRVNFDLPAAKTLRALTESMHL